MGFVAILAAGALLLVLPAAAHAWGPGTHVYLGMEVLRSLNLVSPSLASLLAAYPIEFLYGSLAADISMAKKYAPVGRHCHHWHVAREMHEEAGAEPALRAVTTGYLCHLAADVIAHNSFVPRMLLLTSSTQALGHSYWEQRMDARVGADHVALARRIVTEYDHQRADALFDRVLSRTLFSFRTNRRIFRGLIRVSDYTRWQAIFDTVIEHSRWELDAEESAAYLAASFEEVMEFLQREFESRPAAGDPTGDEALARAKRIRREVTRLEGWSPARRLEERADRHFPAPGAPSETWHLRGRTRELADEGVEGALRRFALVRS